MSVKQGCKLLFIMILCLSSYTVLAETEQIRLKVGFYSNYPKVYRTDDGRASGVFIEILEQIAKNENWKLDYVFGTWEECLTRLQNGEIDIMPDVAASEERRKLFDFHQKPVLMSWGCIYTKTDPYINSVFDLTGKTVAVLRGSILTDGEEGIYNLVKHYRVQCNFIEADDYDSVFKLVRDGRADAGVVNRFFGTAFESEYGVKLNNFIFYPTSLYFAFTRNSPENNELITITDYYIGSWLDDMDSVYYHILSDYNLYPKKRIPKWIIPLLSGFGLLLALFITGLALLKWQVNRQTLLLRLANSKLKEEVEEHHNTMDKLQKSRELYRSFVDNIPGLVFMYDKDTNGHRKSLITPKRSEEILGPEVGRKTVLDVNTFFDYVAPEDYKIIEEQALKAENENGILDVEYRVNLDRQTQRWFRSIGRVTILPDGDRRWQGVILDIDDRKNLERQLEHHRIHLEELVESRTLDLQNRTGELEKANAQLKEADRLKSIFLASMSHELRTPLNSIIGFTGILLMGMVGDLTDEQRKQLEIVKNSSKHLLALINEILDISKIEAGKAELALEKINISEVACEVASLLKARADEKHIGLICATEPDFEVFSDRLRLSQILINIAGNALKFTDNGSVNIKVTKKSDNEFEMIISDTGCGVKSEDMHRLFEPFQQIDSLLTKKHEGTGLGLHLTQKIVTLLGGNIKVRSDYGKGTEFIVTLPVMTEVKDEESSGNRGQ